jgi:hypothetical protein
LQSAIFHEPQVARKELRIIMRPLRYVWNGRKVRARPSQAEKDNPNGLHVRRGAAHLDLGNAGDHKRQAYGHEKMVGSSVTFIVNVRAANVSMDDGVREKKEKGRQ